MLESSLPVWEKLWNNRFCRYFLKRIPPKMMSMTMKDVLHECSRHMVYNHPSRAESRTSPIDDSVKIFSDINEHLMTLYMLTIEKRLKSVLELGTRDGESTLALLNAFKQTGGSVTSIDIDACDSAGKRIQDAGLASLWHFIQSNDLIVSWDRPIDHLFIDTSHTYEHTMAELRKYEPWVVRGGIITLHDSASYAGLKKAVDEFLSQRKDLVLYRYAHCNGLDVIVKRWN